MCMSLEVSEQSANTSASIDPRRAIKHKRGITYISNSHGGLGARTISLEHGAHPENASRTSQKARLPKLQPLLIHQLSFSGIIGGIIERTIVRYESGASFFFFGSDA